MHCSKGCRNNADRCSHKAAVLAVGVIRCILCTWARGTATGMGESEQVGGNGGLGAPNGVIPSR